MKKELQLKDQLLENTDSFLEKILEVGDTHFNTKPDEHTWSAAEVLEHMYRSEFGIPIYGFLSRLEWVHFIMLHAKRHVHQLQPFKIQLS